MDISDVWTLKISNEIPQFKPIEPNWDAIGKKLETTLKGADPRDENGPWSFINGDYSDVYFPRSLLKTGFPIELVDYATDVYKSDLSNPDNTYYIDGQPVSHIRGVGHRSLNGLICRALGVHGYRGDFGGHGSAARAVSSAIYEHITVGRHAQDNHYLCDSGWCSEAWHNYKQIKEEVATMHRSGNHANCKPDVCARQLAHAADNHSRCHEGNCEVRKNETKVEQFLRELDTDNKS